MLKQTRGHASTVRSAIEHLPEPAYFARGMSKSEIPLHPNHWTMRPRSIRFQSPELMRSDTRSFRRLLWDCASPTLAFGNREISVHPSGHRRISILEAMLLQGFPATHVLQGTLSEQVTQISNAVAPPVARADGLAIRAALGEVYGGR